MTDFLRRYVVHNWGLKLIALGFAVGLWLAVARDQPAEVAVEVPIEFRNFPESLEISSERIPQAQIRLRGPERLIQRLQPSDVHPEIDLSQATTGERTFVLTAQQIHHPYDVQVVQVIPSELHLTFDTRLNRQVTVHPRVVGTFAPGYSMSRVTADPPVITITGPRKRVEGVEAAITDPVDVSGLMQQGTFTTHAYVSDPLIQVVNPAPIRVTVMMERSSTSAKAH